MVDEFLTPRRYTPLPGQRELFSELDQATPECHPDSHNQSTQMGNDAPVIRLGERMLFAKDEQSFLF